MADSYLTISTIASDPDMTQRVAACAAQQEVSGDQYRWASELRYVWAAAPGWAEAWDYATATHPWDPESGEPPYRPGADPAVITDAQVLAEVQRILDEPGR